MIASSAGPESWPMFPLAVGQSVTEMTATFSRNAGVTPPSTLAASPEQLPQRAGGAFLTFSGKTSSWTHVDD